MDQAALKERLFEHKLSGLRTARVAADAVRPRRFELDGRRFRYATHRYNAAWMNERAVEAALGADLLDRHAGGRVIELGNVMGHYGHRSHEVVDKYETAPGVCNVDVVDLPVDEPYDAVLSLSTVEHVGWDEHPQAADKALAAIERLVALAGRAGELLVTFPLGHNPALDAAVAEDRVPLPGLRYLRRIDRHNAWEQTDRRRVVGARYGEPFAWANAIVVGWRR